MREKVDLPKLFEDLGFIEDFKYPQGFSRLVHPELIIEFLVVEKGSPVRRALSYCHMKTLLRYI